MMRTLAWLLLSFGLPLGLSFGLSACASEICSVDPKYADMPVSAPECRLSELCYAGECRLGCTLSEVENDCRNDSDCSGTHPICDLTSKRCSSCPQGQFCDPVREICLDEAADADTTP